MEAWTPLNKLAISPPIAIYPPVIERAAFLLLLFPLFLLTACVEGEEEVWIEEDGSGRILAHYELPGLARSRLGDPEATVYALENIDDREENIKINEIRFGEENGKMVFHLDATFENALDLLELVERNEEQFIEDSGTDPAQIDAIAGIINFSFESLTPQFSRAVSLGGLFPPAVARRPGMLGPSSFKYTIHLPAKVKETNAHDVSNDGRTVSWTFMLKEHFDSPMDMVVSTELPIPWWVWAILALLTFAFAWLIWRFVIRRFLF